VHKTTTIKPEKKKMNKKIYVELSAYWGNDDAHSTIKVSRRRWAAIQNGAEYETSTWSWYEGMRSRVSWSFDKGLVSINSDDGMQCVLELPVLELIANTSDE
jgi:hypothetical protein